MYHQLLGGKYWMHLMVPEAAIAKQCFSELKTTVKSAELFLQLYCSVEDFAKPNLASKLKVA